MSNTKYYALIANGDFSGSWWDCADARDEAIAQADAILRAAGLLTYSEALDALRTAYADIQRLPGHTIDMLGRIEAVIVKATGERVRAE